MRAARDSRGRSVEAGAAAPDAGARVLAFHKPKGVVVTRSDERGRRTVYDLLPGWVRDELWVPVGRLDRDSRGLLLFVREGRLVELLTRGGGLAREYEVWVRGRVTPAHVAQCLAGVETAAGVMRAERVEVRGGAGPKTRLAVVLREGLNREIRRLFGALRDPERGTPLKVTDLRRTRIGPVALDVPSGAWRFLTAAEVEALVGEARGARRGAHDSKC